MCYPLRLAGHLNDPSSHCVTIQCWGFLKGNVVQERYQILEDRQQVARLVFKHVTRQNSGKYPAEFDADLQSVMRIMEQKTTPRKIEIFKSVTIVQLYGE